MAVIRRLVLLEKIDNRMALLQKKWARLLRHKARVYKL